MFTFRDSKQRTFTDVHYQGSNYEFVILKFEDGFSLPCHVEEISKIQKQIAELPLLESKPAKVDLEEIVTPGMPDEDIIQAVNAAIDRALGEPPVQIQVTEKPQADTYVESVHT